MRTTDLMISHSTACIWEELQMSSLAVANHQLHCDANIDSAIWWRRTPQDCNKPPMQQLAVAPARAVWQSSAFRWEHGAMLCTCSPPP